MRDTYDVGSFDLHYCQKDVSKIARAIANRSSLLVVGMPGCGKSRLFDFLLHRPGALEHHGLSQKSKFIYVDCDLLSTDPYAMYAELLRAFGHDAGPLSRDSVDALRHALVTEVERLAPDTDLVMILDNLSRQLQQALGKSFFDLLFALRNSRQGLNVTYIFVTNLSIDFAGFSRLNRLFDLAPDRSVCWVSLFDQTDTVFSIERQLRRVGEEPDRLNEQEKRRIYDMSGGHALLTRYLTHLTLGGKAPAQADPTRILTEPGIRAACEAIWDDLRQDHRNPIIDLAETGSLAADREEWTVLKDYGVLNAQARFFSPLFECFVKEQEKASNVVGVCCDEARTRILIRTVDDRQDDFPLQRLAQRKRRLLCCLAENLGETCTRDQLMDAGWPSDDLGGVTLQALSRQMQDLRKWLRQHRHLSRYIDIVTEWGEGYKLVVIG